MDPNACWERFLDACEDHDEDEARFALDDLKGWLDKGAYEPKKINKDGIYFLHEIFHRGNS